jgi:hypothetical protein
MQSINARIGLPGAHLSRRSTMNVLLKTVGAALFALTAAAAAQAATLDTVTPAAGGAQRIFDVNVGYVGSSNLLDAVGVDSDVFIGGRISAAGAAFDSAASDLLLLDPVDFSDVLTGSLSDVRISDDLIELLYDVTSDNSAGGLYGALVRATIAFAPGAFTADNALTSLNDALFGLGASVTLTAVAESAPVPVPAALPLLIGALGFVAAVGRRRNRPIPC